MTTPRMVRVAQFGAAHGIRGEVRLKSFTQNPEDVTAYGPLMAAGGRVFEIETLRPAAGSSSPDMFVVRLKGIRDRNAAEKLTRLDLSIPADRLPAKDEGEFYHADLIGLAAVTPDGAAVGTVIAVQNYGAGDLIEIAPPAGPDSTSRTGNSEAVSTEMRPPPEWIMKTGHCAPISFSRTCRRDR